MKKLQILLAIMTLTIVAASCGKKKQSQDIIAPKVEKVMPREPIRMQNYQDERGIDWIGRQYHVAIMRHATDSLPLVTDETGQKFVDNVFSLVIKRQDGSVFFKRSFTKASVAKLLDENFRKNGIFEGLVFDRVDGDWLVFAASVGLPQTDEYIPLVIKLSRMSKLEILRDTEMDTSGASRDSVPSSEDI